MLLSGCVSPEPIVIDSFCNTYYKINLPQEMIDAVHEGQDVEEWVLDTMDNNDYYDEVCP